jgi:hypothetical protein
MGATDDNLGAGSPITVTIDAATQSVRIFFAYSLTPPGSTLHITVVHEYFDDADFIVDIGIASGGGNYPVLFRVAGERGKEIRTYSHVMNAEQYWGVPYVPYGFSASPAQAEPVEGKPNEYEITITVRKVTPLPFYRVHSARSGGTRR